jgi:SNF2-related domain/SNF2 Helicase protein/Helicase conserved C-terminal domain
LVLSDTTPNPEAPPAATLELLWQDDATAFALLREGAGALSSPPLESGIPSVAEVARAGHGIACRRLSLTDLLDLDTKALDLGDTTRVVLAIVDRARRSVAEGLVHPHLEPSDGRWHALWGATLDEVVTDELDGIAAAAPSVCADPFGGDPDGFVHDLYACAVDELARRAIRAASVRPSAGIREPGAAERLLAGLLADEPALPSHGGYAALERRLSAWVDGGLAHRSRAPWNVGLRLSEGASGRVAVALWLEAADDPTLALPASLLRDGDEGVFAFLREGDPRGAVERRLASIDPVLEGAGLPRLAADDPEAVLDDDQVRALLREAMPRLEELGVPVLLPREWVSSPSRVRVNLVATAPGRSSGLLSRDALARFDWRIAIGDVELTEEELTELASAKEPLVRLRGRWHALRAAEVERALRFLDTRGHDASVVDLARALSGVETDEAGLELGRVTLDDALAELVDGDERRYQPRPTPAGMRHDLFPFQERGHGWLRLLGDLGAGGILADEMGLGKTVQAIAMLVSEREDGLAAGPTLVVAPMSVTRQWARELERFAPDLAVHVHHGPDRLSGPALVSRTEASDVVITSYDVVARDLETFERIAWDRLVLDEAQDAKNPATKRHRALRRLPRRRALALTGTPIENSLGELWAIMDLVNPGLLGSRQSFERTFARPIEAGRDARALERLRGLVGPFLLRRAKDAPEVELELPPITIAKQSCLLTVEQASLYRATVDRWMPRIEEQERRFDRRGAVLAMLGQLKQVCNHPELVLPSGRPLEGRSGKLERLVELLRAVPDDDRSLVFTQYPGFGRLAPHLGQRLGVEVGFFHGGLTARARDDLVARFESGTGPEILVVSLRAGGRGLNLPAANHVFHFDRWWNPAVEQQATDRVHRFGQRKHVYVTSLVCTATVEERIDQLLDAKRDLAEQVISGRADDWLAELDLDTLRAAVALAPEAIEEAA